MTVMLLNWDGRYNPVLKVHFVEDACFSSFTWSKYNRKLQNQEIQREYQ